MPLFLLGLNITGSHPYKHETRYTDTRAACSDVALWLVNKGSARRETGSVRSVGPGLIYIRFRG